jgi:hypothetical protein
MSRFIMDYLSQRTLSATLDINAIETVFVPPAVQGKSVQYQKAEHHTSKEALGCETFGSQ